MKNNFSKTMICIFWGVCLIVFPVCLFAKISPVVNFQGYITDKTGMPVIDGEYDVKFSIFDGDSEIASELWNEIQTVTVKNGFYTVSLGAITAFSDPNRDTNQSDALAFSQPYFLGIKVRLAGESTWDEIGFNSRYLPLSSVWSSFRARTSAGRLIALKEQNTEISDNEDMVLVVGNTQITLPQALNASGRMLTIKKIDPKGTVVSIVTKNGETINQNNHDPNDDGNPLELTEKYQEINVISDGRNWISTGTAQVISDGNNGSQTEIEPQSISTTHLINQSVTSAKLDDKSVTHAKLADNSVTSEKLSLVDLTIPAENLQLKSAITNDEIAPDASIAYTKINLKNAIDTHALQDQSVTAMKLNLAPGDLSYSMINLTGLIINSDIAENANIDYSKLNINGSLKNDDIAENASISHTKLNLVGIAMNDILGPGLITYDKLQLTGSIQNSDISPSAKIPYTKLSLANSISTDDLRDNAVSYPKMNINNHEIPYEKLSLHQTIKNSDIADNTQIPYTKLYLENQITANDLQNGVITSSKVAHNAIRSASIVDKSIETDDLADTSITVSKLNTTNEGTSGQVLSTDGIGGLVWKTVSGGQGTIPDVFDQLTVLGPTHLNSVSAQSANITQISIASILTASLATLLTVTVNDIHMQTLKIGQTALINLATSPRSLTLPDLSGQFLISGHAMVKGTDISNKAVETQHINNGAIQDTHIASNAQIPYAKLFLDNAIQGTDIASHTITFDKLSLANRSIPYTLLDLAGSIQPADLASGGLGYSALMLTNQIQSNDIKDLAIQAEDLGDQVITPKKLAGIINDGQYQEALMSDGVGGFRWEKPSPFDSKISEFKADKTIVADQINFPTGIVVTDNNYVIVAERSENKLRIIDDQNQLDTSNTYLAKEPQGMALDQSNHLYVVERENKRVKKYLVNLKTNTLSPETNFGEGYLDDPYGIALDKNGNIYVADAGAHDIKVFTANGSLDYSFNSGKNGGGLEFNTPMDIAIDRSGNIFVLDSHNNRVQKFDANLKYLTAFPENSDLTRPHGITVDNSGNVYVADHGNKRIQIYDNNGNFISTITGSVDFYPKQIAIANSGDIYVSETDRNRIQIFKSEYPIYTIQSTTIGIGTTKPYTSSALQIDSQKGGILIPRMTSEIRENIEVPTEGLMVYQTDSHKGFYFYDGIQWVNFDSNIYENSITGAKIAPDAITSTKIKDNSLTGDDIQDKSLPFSKLAISGTPQDGDVMIADGQSLKWQSLNQLNQILTVGNGGQFSTISSALASIADNSDTNRYLIKISPGTYEEQVTLKPYVDMEGAGENQTIIRFTGGASTDGTSATVIGISNCELRFMTIISQSTQDYALGIHNENASALKLKHVTIEASGGNQNIGIYNAGSTTLTLDNCIVSAETGISHVEGQAKVFNSRILSDENSVNITGGTIQLIGSIIDGTVEQGNLVQAATCVGVYEVNESNLNFLTNTCP